MQNKKKKVMSINITQQIFNIFLFFIGRFIQENKSTKNFLTKTVYNYIHVINKKKKPDTLVFWLNINVGLNMLLCFICYS